MVPIDEVILAACLGSNDFFQQKKMKYFFYSKGVYNDLNFNSIKSASRQLFTINKRTNSVNLPCNSLYVASVDYIDRCGVPIPAYINTNLPETIVDLNVTGGCGCQGQLCNMVKGYEATTEVINAEMPDGSFQDFTCVTRKDVDSNGWYYEQKQYPQRVFTDGEWTDTVLHSENTMLCQLICNENKCIEECEDNYKAVVDCGCYKDYTNVICKDAEVGDTWISFLGSAMDLFSVESGSCLGLSRCGFRNIYNVSENGDRLIFPPNFGWDKVRVRFYQDINLQNLLIPQIAVRTFITGLKSYEYEFDDANQRLYMEYNRRYEQQKLWLIGQLNRYTLKEIGQILSPKTYTPSYIRDWNYWGVNGWNGNNFYNPIPYN